MKAQLKKSHYDGVLYANKESWGRMFSFPASDAAALSRLRDGLWSDPGYHVSFFTTNMGRFDPHGMFDSLLREAEITAPCIFPHPSFFIVTQGGKTMVNLVQRHGNKKLPLLLREVFSSRGLLMEYRECGWFESDKLRLRSLPVLS